MATVEVNVEGEAAQAAGPAPVAAAGVAEPQGASQAPVQEQAPTEGSPEDYRAKFEALNSETSKLQEKAQLLDNLLGHPEFQKWYSGLAPGQLQGKPSPSQADLAQSPLTDEEFADVLADPGKLKKHITEESARIARGIIEPVLKNTQRDLEVLKLKDEIHSFAAEHEDFWDLDQKGLLRPIFQKYPNISVEDAYALAKAPLARQEATQAAHQTVQLKKAATLEKPGVTNSMTTQKVRVRDRLEALTVAYAYAKEGRQPPQFEYGG